MIISRTPLRISFVGGGSDLFSYYRKEPGAIVSTTINKYIYITVNKKFDNKIRASYSRTEIVNGIENLQHTIIKNALKIAKIKGGIEITSIADIPSEGTGLGSSSSYAVGLLNALFAYTGKHSSAEMLAKKACDIEINKMGKPIGKQDQYISAYGGFQYIQFNPDGSVYIDPIILRKSQRQKLEKNILLFYTGITRSADKILAKQIIKMNNKTNTFKVMQKMVSLAKEMRDSLNKGKIDSFGELLHENWLLKKSLTKDISTTQIDDMYNQARKLGALGGKVCGAGGGGFLMIYAPFEKHRSIISALPQLRLMKVSFEPQGSKIIYIEE